MSPLEASIYEKFYSDLIPSEYWEFTLQKDLAIEAISYYVLFNKLIDLDLDRISAPFIFTKKDIYLKCASLLESPEDFTISVDCNGGISAIYMGEEPSIVTIDVDKNKNITLEYINVGEGRIVKSSYANWLAIETVKYDLNKHLENII